MKLLKSLALLLLVVSGGFITHFIYTMTIGDTYGLYEKLENLDKVVSVENYSTYEGSASFTLLLTDDRRITLGSIGKQDLINSDGMMLEQIGPYKIMCKYSSGGSTNGIHTPIISSSYLNQEYLYSIQNLITHYDDIEKLFSTMPIEFDLKTDLEHDSTKSVLLCKNKL